MGDIMFRSIATGMTLMLLAHSSFALSPQQTAAKHQHSYKVRIDKTSNKAHVEADLQLEGNQLTLFNVNPMPNFPNGQADFIENIVVKDAQGKVLSLQNKGEGEYELAGNQTVHLSYDVRLEHDKLNWPAGNEEVLYHTDEGIMMTGYTLFLVPGEKMSGSTKVEFVLPPQWHANTALQATESPSTFIAKTRRELANNAMFFGTAQAEQIDAGGLKLSLVLGKRYWPQRQMFKDLLVKQLQTYLKVFGSKPLAERYLIVINQGDTGDGGAFSGSFSQYLRGDAEMATRPIWGRVLAHELLHFWNGLSLVPVDDREEWFKEGVTDYLTISTMARNKLMDRDYVKQWLENLSRGQTVARRAQGIQESVRDAAKDKHKNWLLVYGGGSIAGLALDVELRRVTKDKIGLEQLMQALYKDVALQGKRYQLDDIEAKAKELSGKDFSGFLTHLVQSKEMFDLAPSFAGIGLRLEQYLLLEHTLLNDPKAKTEDKKRYHTIFGQDF
jgi:predicted metalloprotease with PDZ domain